MGTRNGIFAKVFVVTPLIGSFVEARQRLIQRTLADQVCAASAHVSNFQEPTLVQFSLNIQ